MSAAEPNKATPTEPKQDPAHAAEGEGDSKSQTPGQRLAAQRAAKAARKAAKRGRGAERVEGQLTKYADHAGNWLKERRVPILSTLGAVLVIGGSLGVWWYTQSSQSKAAAELLWEASEAAVAPVIEEEPEEGAPEILSFKSDAKREKAALGKYAKLDQQGGVTRAAVWGHLGQAATLFSAGSYDKAAKQYQAALDSAGDNPLARWRALEGLALSAEAQGKPADARKHLERLERLGNGAFAPIAQYQQARLALADGNKKVATESFAAVHEALNEREEEQAKLEFTKQQVEVRLNELDPTAVQPSAPATPQNYEEIIRRFQAMQKAKGLGGLPGGGAGGSPVPAPTLPAGPPPAQPAPTAPDPSPAPAPDPSSGLAPGPSPAPAPDPSSGPAEQGGGAP